MKSFERLYAVGGSAGGVNVLIDLFKRLPAAFEPPIVVVLHLPSQSSVDVRSVYGPSKAREFVEIEDKMPIANRHVYFAPAGYHVLLEKDETFSLTQDEPVHYSRPAIDVFMASAAPVLGERLVAALLTGANADGAKGLKAIHDAGGTTYVQDPGDAEFSEMPSAALGLIEPKRLFKASELADVFMEDAERGRR